MSLCRITWKHLALPLAIGVPCPRKIAETELALSTDLTWHQFWACTYPISQALDADLVFEREKQLVLRFPFCRFRPFPAGGERATWASNLTAGYLCWSQFRMVTGSGSAPMSQFIFEGVADSVFMDVTYHQNAGGTVAFLLDLQSSHPPDDWERHVTGGYA